MSESTCRSCGAKVVWVTTPSGRRMPVDAEPHGWGNLCLLGDRLVGPDEPGATRHLSHFATCNRPDYWRKK